MSAKPLLLFFFLFLISDLLNQILIVCHKHLVIGRQQACLKRRFWIVWAYVSCIFRTTLTVSEFSTTAAWRSFWPYSVVARTITSPITVTGLRVYSFPTLLVHGSRAHGTGKLVLIGVPAISSSKAVIVSGVDCASAQMERVLSPRYVGLIFLVCLFWPRMVFVELSSRGFIAQRVLTSPLRIQIMREVVVVRTIITHQLEMLQPSI